MYAGKHNPNHAAQMISLETTTTTTTEQAETSLVHAKMLSHQSGRRGASTD